MKFFLNPLFNFLYENVIVKDFFFLNRHILINDQYSTCSIGPLKNDRLADGGNPKYILRHGLGWGFIWVLPQGHVNVISRSNQPKRVRIFNCCCFCFNCINLGCLQGSSQAFPAYRADTLNFPADTLT